MEIVEARERVNSTQGELARQMGDRQQNISRFESGAQNVTVGALEKIAKAVGGRLIVRIGTGRGHEWLKAGRSKKSAKPGRR